MDTTGIEARSSLGICERHHQPLRNVYRKLEISYPKVPKTLLLAMAVKGINDTLGPESLGPSLLVFGEYPQSFTKSEASPGRPPADMRAKIAHQARIEMSKEMSKVRLSRALKYAVPPSTDDLPQVGDKVLVWRENIVNNKIGEWLGPYIVDNYGSDRKLVWVQIGDDNPPKPFGLAQVKRYYEPEQIATTFIIEISDR